MTDDDWDAETETLLDYLARTSREKEQNSMYPRKASTSAASGTAEGTRGVPTARGRYYDIFEDLILRVRVVSDVEGQIRAMRILASWLDDTADQLLVRDSINFHRSTEWH